MVKSRFVCRAVHDWSDPLAFAVSATSKIRKLSKSNTPELNAAPSERPKSKANCFQARACKDQDVGLRVEPGITGIGICVTPQAFQLNLASIQMPRGGHLSQSVSVHGNNHVPLLFHNGNAGQMKRAIAVFRYLCDEDILVY